MTKKSPFFDSIDGRRRRHQSALCHAEFFSHILIIFYSSSSSSAFRLVPSASLMVIDVHKSH
jgi:hypothetical protein